VGLVCQRACRTASSASQKLVVYLIVIQWRLGMTVSRRKSTSKTCWCCFPTARAVAGPGCVRFPELEASNSSVHRCLSIQRSGCRWPSYLETYCLRYLPQVVDSP